MDFEIVPSQKPVQHQSGPFWHKNRQGLGQSLLEAQYGICFAAGLSRNLANSLIYSSSSAHSLTTIFITADVLQPWQAWRKKFVPPSELGLDGVEVFKMI